MEIINQMSTAHREFDVFLSFRGPDTRRSFISFFYKELGLSNIRTFKDDKDLESGDSISPELIRAIEESRFAVVVVSVNYAASPWCLEELVKIMEVRNKGSLTVMPIFYGVNPSDVRRQIGVVAEHFKKHEDREDLEKVRSWRQALKSLADISGYSSCDWDDDSEMVDDIAERISKKLMIAKPRRSGSKLVEIDRHMKAIRRLLDLNSNKSVRVFGIWSRGSYCRSALAKYLYQDISQHFEYHCFLESVKRFSRHVPHLRQDFLKKIQGDYTSESKLKNQKVLLVADDVNKLEQIETLAEYFINFGPGSIVIVTTQDKQLLNSYGIKPRHIYEVDLLRFKISELFRQLAFNKRDISAAFKSAFFKAKKWLGYVVNLVMKIFRINL